MAGVIAVENRQTYLDNISLNNLKGGGPDLNSKQVNPQFIKQRFQNDQKRPTRGRDPLYFRVDFILRSIFFLSTS